MAFPEGLKQPNINWRKSSSSAGAGECVEVGQRGPNVLVRDSKNPEGARLHFGPKAWEVFTAVVKTGGKSPAAGQR